MNLTLDSAETATRNATRAFLSERGLRVADLPESLDERIAVLRDWQRDLYDAGLVGIGWPTEFGGHGGTASQQIVANLELARAGAPEPVGVIGLEVVGPSILEYASPVQKRAYVPAMLRAEEIWCQGFSEPGAGSDLAALKTRAEDRGGHFVISGQKTWTSYAQYARWCAVLARTSEEDVPHRGISYLIVDMQSRGVEVRPLTQITGDAEFAEVFFDNVEVPAENVIGERGQGWAIAMHTLSHERGPAVAGRQAKLRVLLDRMIDEACSRTRGGRPAIEDPIVLQQIARSHVALEVLRHQSYRSLGQSAARGRPGLESSVDKIWLALAEQQLGATCLDLLGPRTGAGGDESLTTELQNIYLYGRAASVYGGTIQIQRNIIAQRTLGLPKS
jgi:alkylation response protein AidB-like acyl-CoA dehydrogenase